MNADQLNDISDDTELAEKEYTCSLDKFLALPLEKRYKWGRWYLTPFALGWCEWDQWDAHIKARHPIQHFFRETVCDFFYFKFKRFSRWKHEVYCKLFRPANILKFPDLSVSWVDKSTMIEASIEKCLIDFVEKEDPFTLLNWEWNDAHVEAKKVILDCYDFFKVIKPAKLKEIDDLTEKGFGKNSKKELQGELALEIRTLEDKFDVLQTEYLIKVVKFRHFLWT